MTLVPVELQHSIALHLFQLEPRRTVVENSNYLSPRRNLFSVIPQK